MFSTIVLTFTLSAAPSANWTQFRGPGGDGVAPAGAKVPTAWSERENIRWKTPVHDKGWSSPVVWGDRIWLTTAKADGKEFFAISIDKNSGKILHDISLRKVESPAFCHPFNSYASCTPCIEDGRVYIHFGSYGTFCLDSATGKTIWENKDYKCDHFRGPGSSPILFENLLILTFDGFDLKYQVALDKATGKQVWKQDHNIKYSTTNGDYHKAYGTPSVLSVKGEAQLVVPAAEATIAYNPRTGQELWRVHTGGMNQSIRPIHAHDLIYLSAGHEQKLFAVKAGQSGTVPAAGIAWKAMKEAPTRPSFLVLGDFLYMVNDKAIATCLEAKTGKPVWRERLDGEFSSSPVAVGNLIFISNEANRSGEEGKTFVFEASETYKPVSVNKLAAGVMASPAVIEDGLILRTKTHLYRIGAK